MTDNLTIAQRSYCMSRVKGKNTQLELRVRSELHRRGFRYRVHVRTLPGCPDIVFSGAKVIVFVDGDFWHGYRFHLWKSKMPPFWQEKIAKTIRRDANSRRKLRALGWTVLRIWQHQLEKDFNGAVSKIVSTLPRS